MSNKLLNSLPLVVMAWKHLAMRAELIEEFEAGEGSFLLRLRTELIWDWDAFYRCTSLVYDVACISNGSKSIDTPIAQGFWMMDTWVREWTSHESFNRPKNVEYEQALLLLHELTQFLFEGVSPYQDDTLERMAKNGA